MGRLSSLGFHHTTSGALVSSLETNFALFQSLQQVQDVKSVYLRNGLNTQVHGLNEILIFITLGDMKINNYLFLKKKTANFETF